MLRFNHTSTSREWLTCWDMVLQIQNKKQTIPESRKQMPLMYRFVETRQIKWVCLGMYLTKLTSDGEDDDKPLNGIRKRISKQSQINSFPLVYLLYPTNEPSKWSHVSPSHGMSYQSSKMLWNQQHSKILVPPSLCGLGSCPAAGLPALNISKYIILANSRVSKLNLECVLTRSSLYVSEYRFNMRSSLNGLP